MRFSHTVQTTAPPEKIWQIWTDVAHWPQWDTELRSAHLLSPFELGAIGKITPKVGRASTFQISQIQPGHSYTMTVQLPLCQLQISRYLDAPQNVTTFTHRVSFEGWLAFLFGLILGRRFKAVLPAAMENVRQLAE